MRLKRHASAAMCMAAIQFIAVMVPAAAATAQESAYVHLTWERRWAIADSLLEESRQVGNAGDRDRSLVLIDEALQAHPSHYKSWFSRWRLLMRRGRQEGTADSVIASWIEADLPKAAAGDDFHDRPFVLSLGWDFMYQLTGREDYLTRRRQVLRDYLQTHPDNNRAFEFKVTLGFTASEDDEARRWYEEALSDPPWPSSVSEVAQSMVRRDLEHPFLTRVEVDSVYIWWGRSGLGDPRSKTEEMIRRALWRGRFELMRNGDLSAAERHLQDIDSRRRELVAHEDRLRRLFQDQGAALAPFAVIDALAEQLRGDLATVRGDSSSARSYYRSAWQHIAPIADGWGPESDRNAAPAIRRLRDELLPLVGEDVE